MQAHDHRAFVVANTPAVNLAVLLDHLKRVGSPTVAGGHDVEVSENPDTLFALPDLGIRARAVDKLRFKPVSSGFCDKPFERAQALLAVRRAVFGRGEHAGYGNNFRQIVEDSTRQHFVHNNFLIRLRFALKSIKIIS